MVIDCRCIESCALPISRSALELRCAVTGARPIGYAPQLALTFELEASAINSHSDRARLMMTRRMMAIFDLPFITHAFVEQTHLNRSTNRII